MELADIFTAVKEKVGDSVVHVEDEAEPHLTLGGDKLVEACEFLKGDPRLDCDLLSCITAVDLKGLKGEKDEGFEMIYHIESTTKLHSVALRLRVSRDQPILPSICHVWATADWHEREAYDLMGVQFTGHPNLTRILCAEDWVGHPLRKDYEFPTHYHGIVCEFEGNEDGTWGGHPS